MHQPVSWGQGTGRARLPREGAYTSRFALGALGGPAAPQWRVHLGFRNGVAGRAGAPGRGTTQTHRATFLRTALPPRGHCNRLRSPLKRQNQSVPLKTESHRLPMDGRRRPRSAPRSGRARPCGHAGPWEAVSTAWRPLLSQGTRGAPKLLPAVGGPHRVFPPANPGAQRPGLRRPSPGHGAQNARPPRPRPRCAAP